MTPAVAMNGMRPIVLPANQPRQFYRGGAAISALRGIAPHQDDPEFRPEDWVASTTTRFGADTDGLSRLPTGGWLRDAVRADPVGWLGEAHVAAFGDSTALLVKLLDAGQRLPVHCHPNNAFAQACFGSPVGKTEAWVVIGTSGPDPRVHIGFERDIERAELAGWVVDQQPGGLLGALNSTQVAAGDTVFIPAGLPHAIGAGVFIVELQQPTDLSVTLEWSGFLADERAGHLGIGFAIALDCVDRRGWGDGRWETLVRHTTVKVDGGLVNLLGPAAEPFFRADRLRVTGAGLDLAPSFAVLVVLAGTGYLHTARGGSLPLSRGQTVVVPFAAGSSTVDGDLTVVRCRPPKPQRTS